MNGIASILAGMLILGGVLSGCAGRSENLPVNDASGTAKSVTFPPGTAFGGASKEQASTLARLFVESHNLAMQGLADVKGDIGTVNERTRQIEASNQRVAEMSKKNLEAAETALKKLTDLAKEQGTGEITLFFPVGKSQLKSDTMEYARLVNFADYLSQESKGRKVLFITIGSASAVGNKQTNERLASKRAEAPAEALDKYLVNIPHSYFKTYGTGDLYSPKGVNKKDHERYQHVRIIAVYETDQLPQLPAGS